MRTFIALCLVAVALSHPVNNNDEQVAENGHVIQKRDTQNVEGVAHQDDDKQEAYNNEGAYVLQDHNGQLVHASDYGGTILQVHQLAQKKCCGCGCGSCCDLEGAAPASN